MKPGALTQAARSAAPGWTAPAPARRIVRARPGPRREAPGDRRASRAARPPRRVSGPAKGKAYASRPKSAGALDPADERRPLDPGHEQPPAPPGRRARRARSGRRVCRAASWRADRPPSPRPSRLPLRRPFIDREPAPRPAPKPVPAPAPAKSAKPATGILQRLGAFVVSLPDHSLLDRVVRGRAWIPLLGVLLAGIVAAQVEILKLGASMGRSLEQTTTLTSQNELLRDSVASLSDDQRIERLATSMGMVLPPPGAVGYLTANQDGDVSRALGNIHAPDAAAFMALTPSERRARDRCRHVDAADKLRASGAGRHARERDPDDHAERHLDGNPDGDGRLRGHGDRQHRWHRHDGNEHRHPDRAPPAPRPRPPRNRPPRRRPRRRRPRRRHRPRTRRARQRAPSRRHRPTHRLPRPAPPRSSPQGLPSRAPGDSAEWQS